MSKDAVEGIIDLWVSTQVDWSELPALRKIGIDEITLTRGHGKYVAVISTRDRHGNVSVLTMLPNRLKSTVKAILESIPEALKKTIDTVCTAMYDGYIDPAYEALAGVTVVVDRFHVAQHYRDGAVQLRKQELTGDPSPHTTCVAYPGNMLRGHWVKGIS